MALRIAQAAVAVALGSVIALTAAYWSGTLVFLSDQTAAGAGGAGLHWVEVVASLLCMVAGVAAFFGGVAVALSRVL